MRHELSLLLSVLGYVWLSVFVPLYVIRLSRQNLTTKAHFFQNRQQRYNNFSRYANNVLIYMRVRVFSILCSLGDGKLAILCSLED